MTDYNIMEEQRTWGMHVDPANVSEAGSYGVRSSRKRRGGSVRNQERKQDGGGLDH